VSAEEKERAAEKLRAMLNCLESAENLARELGLSRTVRMVIAARLPLYSGPVYGPVIAEALDAAIEPVVLRVERVIGPLMADDETKGKEVVTCSYTC
jgi:hypothetical protein